MFQDSQPTQEEASLKVHRSRSVRRVEVTTDGRNLVSHAGTALLCELADRTGLTRAMSVAMADCGISWNTHDPGVVLTHLAVAIADGGGLPERLRSAPVAVRTVRRGHVDLDRLEGREGHGIARAAPDPKGSGGRTRDRVGRGTAG